MEEEDGASDRHVLDCLPCVFLVCYWGSVGADGLTPQLSTLLEPIAPSAELGSKPKFSELCGFETWPSWT